MARVQQDSGTTSAGLAETAEGYQRNGLGAWTRAAAHHAPIMPKGFADRAPVRWRTTSEQIARLRHELRKVEVKLGGQLSDERRAKLETARTVKTRFIEKLRAERAELFRKGAANG